MTSKEEHVDFIPRDGVTIYTGRGITPHPAGTPVRLPKSQAEALKHLRAEDAAASAKDR